jgi:hypothetical protein
MMTSYSRSLWRVAVGALGFLAITFPLAYTWHLVVFAATYDRLGYISREEPIIAFGFAAILIQGVLLAIAFPYLRGSSSVAAGAIRFFAVMGVYHWSTHVVAEAAKHDLAPLGIWFAMESIYLAIQFALATAWLAFVNRATAGRDSQ